PIPQPSAGQAVCKAVPRRPLAADRGASMLEYGAVVLLIALIAGAVFGFGVPGKVARLFEAGFEGVETATGGGPSAGPQEDGRYWNQADPDDPGHQGPPPGHPAGPPAEPTHPDDPGYQGPPPGHPAGPPEEPYEGPEPEHSDPENVQAALDELDECLERWNEDAPWFSGSCAWDVYKDLSLEDFAGVVDRLSPQELQRLFESGPIPLDQDYFDFIDDVMELSHLDTIRALQDSGATPFAQPGFDGVGGDPASGDTPGDVTYREPASYSLYGSTEDGEDPVKWEHIDQNSLGDCWLMATMGAMAVQSPGLVEEMIEENPNGTFTVTFPGRDPITVTPDLPTNPDGTLAFAGSQEDPPVIWPAVIEKAYAQMEGNDYGNIENWHPGGAMNTFTGDAGLDYIPDFTGTDIDTLADDFENGEAITFSTPPNGDDKEKKELIQDNTLVSGHVYFVTSVDRENGTVTVRNPWGPHTDDIVMTIDEVNDN